MIFIGAACSGAQANPTVAAAVQTVIERRRDTVEDRDAVNRNAQSRTVILYGGSVFVAILQTNRRLVEIARELISRVPEAVRVRYNPHEVIARLSSTRVEERIEGYAHVVGVGSVLRSRRRVANILHAECDALGTWRTSKVGA